MFIYATGGFVCRLHLFLCKVFFRGYMKSDSSYSR